MNLKEQLASALGAEDVPKLKEYLKAIDDAPVTLLMGLDLADLVHKARDFVADPQPLITIETDREGNPLGPVAYLDGDDSLLCAYCALQSNTREEIEQFRPKVPVLDIKADETCDQCSDVIDPGGA